LVQRVGFHPREVVGNQRRGGKGLRAVFVERKNKVFLITTKILKGRERGKRQR
jgi:hypothetical protein